MAHISIIQMVNARNQCRAVARLLIGLRHNRATLMSKQDAGVIKLIAHAVYDTRGHDKWRR